MAAATDITRSLTDEEKEAIDRSIFIHRKLLQLAPDNVKAAAVEIAGLLKGKPSEIDRLTNCVLNVAHVRFRMIERLAQVIQDVMDELDTKEAFVERFVDFALLFRGTMRSTMRLLFELADRNVVSPEVLTRLVKEHMETRRRKVLCYVYLWLSPFVFGCEPRAVERLYKEALDFVAGRKLAGLQNAHLEKLVARMESYDKAQWEEHKRLIRDVYPEDTLGYAIWHDNIELFQKGCSRKLDNLTKLCLSALDPGPARLPTKSVGNVTAYYGAVECFRFLTKRDAFTSKMYLFDIDDCVQDCLVGGSMEIFRNVYDLQLIPEELLTRSIPACAATDHLEILQWLERDRDIDVNAVHEGQKTILAAAAKVNNTEMMRWAIERGADVNATSGRHGWTPIFYAVRYSNIDAFLLLFSRDDVSLTCESTHIIHHAALYAQKDIIQHLLSRLKLGPNVFAKDSVCFSFISSLYCSFDSPSSCCTQWKT